MPDTGRGATLAPPQPGEHDMHPILREILLEPVGWLAIGGSILMVGISVFVALFVRRKVREEEKKRR
jgi:hypothetical protein